MPEVPEGVKLDFGSPQFIDFERIGVLQRLDDPLRQTAACPGHACSLRKDESHSFGGLHVASLPNSHACHSSCAQPAAPLGHATVGGVISTMSCVPSTLLLYTHGLRHACLEKPLP